MTPTYEELEQRVKDLERETFERSQAEEALRKSEECNMSFLHDEEGNPLSIMGVSRDIAERKQAQEALRESEEKYRSMMEAMKDPLYIRSLEYRVEYMNSTMIKQIGRDATGEYCFKALHNLDAKCPWCMKDKVQAEDHLEYDIVSPRDHHSYHVSQSPVFHRNGSVSKMTILRDTSELKSLETQLQQAQKSDL